MEGVIMSGIDDDFAISVAIIGMSGRFPGAKNTSEFWDVLKNAQETITHFSEEEIRAVDFDADYTLEQDNYVRARGVLSGVEYFDAEFFNFTAKEAELTDPQQRIWLEVAYEALEKSGYAVPDYDGLIGVYTGYTNNSYLMHNLLGNRADVENYVRVRHGDDYTVMTLNSNVFLATKTAYKLGLKGPAISLGTACSTSLASVVLATRSLLAQETDICIAGGVNIMLPQTTGYFYQEGAILSRDGHCRPFDASASGTVIGSGCGAVVLKRLEDALEDHDNILAVIRGAAINNDGASKAGFITPSANGQAECIRLAQAFAGVSPESIDYVETLGTATPIGDLIEFSGLTEAFGKCDSKRQFCGIGSVKGNIGHLDVASGVAGLIKTILALQHKKIPATLHFRNPNPYINFDDSPFYVVDRLTDWKSDNGKPRRAGVSSFGIGGTNAHLVLEEAPGADSSTRSSAHQVLCISAKNETALSNSAGHLAEAFCAQPDINISDAAWTLLNRRQHFRERMIAVCDGTAESAAKSLTASRSVLSARGRVTAEPQLIVFGFPDGEQVCGVASELRRHEPVFNEALEECCRLASRHVEGDFSDLFSGDISEADYLNRTGDSGVRQLTVFSVDYSLARLWQSFGLEPDFLLGYGPGEWVAACVSGVVSLSDAMDAVWQRSQVMGNSSGESEPVASFEQCLRKMTFHPPQLPIISAATGETLSSVEATDPGYWAAQMRQPVQLQTTLNALRQNGKATVLLECGPSNKLISGCELRVSSARQLIAIATLGGPREIHEHKRFLGSVGRLWILGISVDMKPLFGDEFRKTVDIPSYGFNRQRYWVDPPVNAANHATPSAPRVRASGDMRSILTEIWADIFGKPASSISPTEDFREQGGDSLAAIRLMGRIRRETGISLPLNALDTAGTITDMAELIASKSEGNRGQVSACLVQVKAASNNTRPILFVVHGSGGDVHWGYVNISSGFDDDQAMWGFEPPRDQLLETLEDMASFYIREMKTVQPEGPYFLAGFCWAGTLAYEMACQLRESGDEVGYLGLIEAVPSNRGFGKISLTSDYVKQFAANFPRVIGEFVARPREQQKQRIVTKIRRLKRIGKTKVHRFFDASVDEGELTRFNVEDIMGDINNVPDLTEETIGIWENSLRIMQKHTSRNSDVPLEVFSSSRQPLNSPLDPEFGWRKVTTGTITCHVLQGSHDALVVPPLSMELGKLLCKRLKIAQQRYTKH